MRFLDNGISASSTLVGRQTQGPLRLFTGNTSNTSFSNRYPPSLCQLIFIPFHSNYISVTHHSCSHSHPRWTYSAYAEVPLNFWIQDLFFLDRNHYARLDRFGQEWVPASPIREILLRQSPLASWQWIFCLATFECLALRRGV